MDRSKCGLWGRPRFEGFPEERSRPLLGRAVPATITAAMATTVTDLLRSIDPEAPGDDILESYVAKLATAGITLPIHMEGLAEEEAAGLVEGLGSKSFMRRAVRSKNVGNVDRWPNSSNSPPNKAVAIIAPGDIMQQRLEESFGVGSSDAVAAALSELPISQGKTVPEFLTAGHLSGLSHSLQCGDSIWRSLWAETLKARESGRIVHTFVDLTAKEFVPGWLPITAIGGNSETRASIDDFGVQRLSDIGHALSKAMQRPRSFRSTAQWASAFLRFAAVAICTEQMSAAQVWAYLALVLKLSEDEKTKANGLAELAWVYDALFRESLCKRCRNHEQVDLDKAFSELCDTTLSAARSRFKQSFKNPQGGSSASSGGADQSAATLRASLEAQSSLKSQVDKANKQLQQSMKGLQAREKSAGGKGTPQKRDRDNYGGNNSQQSASRIEKREKWWQDNHNKKR